MKVRIYIAPTLAALTNHLKKLVRGRKVLVFCEDRLTLEAEKAVASANEHVSRAESIRKIKVLTTDFTEANGLLTPSLKVKRLEATRRLAPIIDEIYGGPVQA